MQRRKNTTIDTYNSEEKQTKKKNTGEMRRPSL